MSAGTEAIAEEVDAALARLDPARLRREYRAQDEFLLVPEFLSDGAVGALVDDARGLEPGLNRSYVPRHKKGGSVSAFAIAEDGPALLALYRSERFRRFLSDLVGAPLQCCPEEDPHACALYFYTEPGDHIGFHFDTSYYKGARYTVLLGLIERSSSRLLCQLYKRQPQRQPVDLQLATHPGTLILFNGDKLWHAVSPLGDGEERVSLTLEYVTDPSMHPAKRLFSNLKDAFAYFGLKAVFRRPARA